MKWFDKARVIFKLIYYTDDAEFTYQIRKVVSAIRIVIIGGGKVGKNLAQMQLEKKHIVSLIEKDVSKCSMLADSLDAEVLRGDGTDIHTLEDAGIRRADCFMAVTGKDQDNLVAAQLAKNYFAVKKVIVRANDPRNIETFRAMGIINTVSSTEIISKLIEIEADLTHMHLIATLGQGRANICSIILPEKTVLSGMSLQKIDFPHGSLMISVIRSGTFIIPNGSTVFQPQDEVVAVCEDKCQKLLMKMLSEEH